MYERVGFISISEAAQRLSVTPATIHNWIRTGKIVNVHREHRRILLERAEIETIYKNLESDNSTLLKTRRNKLFKSGYAIPFDYVSDERYHRLIKTIVTDYLPKISDWRLLLMEIVLKLLMSRGKISLKANASPGSYVVAYQRSEMDIDPLLEDVFGEIVNLRQLAPSERDIETLGQLNRLEIPWVKGQDFLGLAYMSLSQIKTRKRTGSYYTPRYLVDDLTSEIMEYLLSEGSFCRNLSTLRICDPCAGSGNFLVALFFKLRDALRNQGYSDKQAEEILLGQVLYGNDIDPIAVALAQINLVLASSVPRSAFTKLNIRRQNTLIDVKDSPAFDVVIGNPPWGSVITEAERQLFAQVYESAQGICDPYALFLEKGLKLLKPGGFLAYVLPESFLNITCHHHIRHVVLSSVTVRSISLRGYDFKTINAPVITLVVQNLHPSEVHRFKFKGLTNSGYISQKKCLDNEFHVIIGELTADDAEILKQMESIPGVTYLKGQAQFGMGIVTGNNKRHIYNHCPPNGERIVRGNNIYRYRIVPGSTYIVFEPERFQQVAPERLYRAKEKLVYRFINKKLIVAYDNCQLLTLNSANIVIPSLPKFHIKYVLAVLNSRAVQFFFTKKFNAVKVLRQHLEAIPIPPASEEVQNAIVAYVDQILSTEDQSKVKELYERLDQLVMSLFHLSPNQQQSIVDQVGEPDYLFPKTPDN